MDNSQQGVGLAVASEIQSCLGPSEELCVV